MSGETELKPSQESLEIAAQCWCDPETSDIEMGARLATAFAKRLDAAKATPPGYEMVPEGTMAEDMAKVFHAAYEGLAPSHAYETRIDSRTNWENVPANQKSLMVETCNAVLIWLRHRATQNPQEPT